MAKKKSTKPALNKSIPKRQTNRRLRMMVIPEPEPNTRAVLIYTGEGTVVMQGEGNVTMECGNCSAPLIEGVPTGNIQNIVLKCPQCGAFNETLA